MSVINRESLRASVYKKCNEYNCHMLSAEEIYTIIDNEPDADAIPFEFIHSLIIDPHNAGDKSRVLSWLLRKWRERVHEKL